MKIFSFTQLDSWKCGHNLVLLIYDLTKKFPQEERYSLVDQIRRAAVSITSNIAEGFSRKTDKEKIQFYFMSKGSLCELQNQLIIAKDIGYIKNEDFNKLVEETNRGHKLLNGLIKSAKSYEETIL